ncbi:unnamed protein product [Bathycoccus prasinos]
MSEPAKDTAIEIAPKTERPSIRVPRIVAEINRVASRVRDRNKKEEEDNDHAEVLENDAPTPSQKPATVVNISDSISNVTQVNSFIQETFFSFTGDVTLEETLASLGDTFVRNVKWKKLGDTLASEIQWDKVFANFGNGLTKNVKWKKLGDILGDEIQWEKIVNIVGEALVGKMDLHNLSRKDESTGVRERTRMTDIETKWRKDRARLLVRVKAGAVPNEDSQEKYKLSLAEINVVRADAGLPELDRPYRVNAFAGMMAINAETERLQGEVLEQMNLTQNLRDDVRGLDQRMKQMVVEEQGRRVVVPAGEQFTLETIHDHFWMPVGAEGKPRGWEIDRAGKRASETTIKIRFGSKKNYRM